MVWFGLVRFGLVWFGLVGLTVGNLPDLTQYGGTPNFYLGRDWFGLMRLDYVWFGLVDSQ